MAVTRETGIPQGVAPKAKTVTVYRADGSAKLLPGQEFVEGEDVLPGLRIALPELFE